MRIRSIRPEFWSSEDIAALTWEQRLIYIGLWSYVDDNGVGRDSVHLIAAALFPYDEDREHVSVSIHGALSEYSTRKMVTRYTVNEKRFLHITAWDKHQKINRPSGGRYPPPTREDAVIHGVLSEPSVSPQAESPLGEGEKRRRGTAKAGAALAAENSGTLIKEWIDNQPRRPPDQVVGQVAKHVGQLLNGDGYTSEQVRSGLLAWQSRGLHPNALPSIVHEITTPRSRPKPRNQVETETWLAEAWERAEAADLAAERKELE